MPETWIWVGRVADIVGIAGVIVTAYAAMKARTAAHAAQEARDAAIRASATAEFVSLVEVLNQIRALQRVGRWEVVLDRYATLRTRLVRARSRHPSLTAEAQATVQGVLSQLRTIENEIERTLQEGRSPDTVNLNARVGRQTDRLEEVVSKVLRSLE